MYVVPESVGSVRICVATNVTLNGSRSAAGLVQTVDVTAESESLFVCIRPSNLLQILTPENAFSSTNQFAVIENLCTIDVLKIGS